MLPSYHPVDSSAHHGRLHIATVPVVHVERAAFDVTPARLVTGLITERGLCDASAEGLRRLFPGRL